MITGIIFLVLGAFCLFLTGICLGDFLTMFLLSLLLGLFCLFLGSGFLMDSRDKYYRKTFPVISTQAYKADRIEKLEKQLLELREED